MEKYIMLLRGINVGGRNKLLMKELRDLLKDFDFQNVKTYIQSGNVIFTSTDLDTVKFAEDLSNTIKEQFGFSPRILVIDMDAFEKIITENPFPDAKANPKSLHVYFLEEQPANPDLTSLDGMKKESEQFVLKDCAFYLHAPEGIGRSKLAAGVEKALGVNATARNWRTVNKLQEMISE